MIPESNKLYTYNDYLTLSSDEQIEIIEGHIYNMSSPSAAHQRLSMILSAEIYNYIKANNGQCEVFTAPFDVVLTNETDINNSNTVVIPDISVICDKNKITSKCCVGSPDMIIEIVSPSNASNDYVRKLYEYEKYQVKEYWIVNPIEKNIFVYTLNNNTYGAPKVYTFKDKVKVNLYNNLSIDFNLLNI